MNMDSKESSENSETETTEGFSTGNENEEAQKEIRENLSISKSIWWTLGVSLFFAFLGLLFGEHFFIWWINLFENSNTYIDERSTILASTCSIMLFIVPITIQMIRHWVKVKEKEGLTIIKDNQRKSDKLGNYTGAKLNSSSQGIINSINDTKNNLIEKMSGATVEHLEYTKGVARSIELLKVAEEVINVTIPFDLPETNRKKEQFQERLTVWRKELTKQFVKGDLDLNEIIINTREIREPVISFYKEVVCKEKNLSKNYKAKIISGVKNFTFVKLMINNCVLIETKEGKKISFWGWSRVNEASGTGCFLSTDPKIYADLRRRFKSILDAPSGTQYITSIEEVIQKDKKGSNKKR